MPDLMQALKDSLGKERVVYPPTYQGPYHVEQRGRDVYSVLDSRGESVALCWTREVAELLKEALP